MEAEGPNCVCWLGCVAGMGFGGWDCVSCGFGGWGCVLGVGLVVGFVLPTWVWWGSVGKKIFNNILIGCTVK
jgi:hypothetical protein